MSTHNICFHGEIRKLFPDMLLSGDVQSHKLELGSFEQVQ